MSEDRRGGPARAGGGADDPPMLMLGEDRPDVEDTTAEELARQRQELEERRRQLEEEDRRRRHEAEKEAERLRLEAEKKLGEERRQAEVELARRQRELDDAERRLDKTERRLRRKAQGSGGQVFAVSTRTTRPTRSPRTRTRNPLLAAAERRSGVPVPRMPVAVVLALVASGLTVAGAIASIDAPASEAVDSFVTLDETRVAWLDAGVTLDGEVVRYLAGEDVTSADGTLPSLVQAEAASLTTRRDWYLETFQETLAPLVVEPGSNPQRVLSAWHDSRDAAGMAVPYYEVNDAAEALDTDRALPTWLLLGGMVAVGGLAYSLARGRTWVGAGLAGLALVPGGMVVADQDRHLDVEPALAAHDEAADVVRDVYDQVGRDLEVVYGTRALDRWEQENYWVRSGGIDEETVNGAALDVYSEARGALAEVDIRALTIEESLPYAEALIEAGSALLATETASLVDARGAVVAGTVSDLDVGPYVAATAAAALLPLAALVPAAMRRREVER